MSEVQEDSEKAKIFPEDYRKISSLAPRLDGGAVLRLTVGHLRDVERDDEAPDFVFAVFVLEDDEREALAIIADLQIVVDGYFAAVTVSNDLRLDNRSETRLDKESGELLGHWAAHTLYDFAVSNLKAATIHHHISTSMSFPMTPENYPVYFSNRDEVRNEESEES